MHLASNTKDILYKIRAHSSEETEEEWDIGILVNYRNIIICNCDKAVKETTTIFECAKQKNNFSRNKDILGPLNKALVRTFKVLSKVPVLYFFFFLKINLEQVQRRTAGMIRGIKNIPL